MVKAQAADRGPMRVVGRYALYSEIAAGGMATVHIGRLLGPVGFARTVAVKRLHPQYAKDPEFVSMFLDEARLAARVQHPNVVATIDVVATDGELFLIMDYVRGESLSKLLRVCRKQGIFVPPRIAASIICGFLHGLHAAHEAKNERGEPINLVHRDVSPQNVLVGADGIPRVLDFGIAKAQGRVQVTRDGQIKGKLAYMPPEQLSGRDVTRAVDIYASAVVMWEMLTNERLFKGENESETLARILRDPVPPPSAVVPDLTRAFDKVLLKALSREAKERHATARELAFDLEKCVGVASATEVGEWVENLVGPVLSAREDQIAQIESNSAGIRISDSGRPEADTLSDSDVSAVPAAASGTMPMARALQKKPTPTAPMSPMSGPSLAALAGEGAASDDSTGSKVTGSRAMALPVDRKMPMLAVGAGLLVLVGIVGYVVFSRPGKDGEAGAGPDPSASVAAASAASAAGTASAAGAAGAATTTATAGSASATQAAPAPSSSAADPGSAGTTATGGSATTTATTAAATATIAATTTTASPTATTATTTTTTTTTSPAAHTGGHATAAATTHGGGHTTTSQPGRPTATAAPPPATSKKNCDPPYTIDANGRKKYKLECM